MKEIIVTTQAEFDALPNVFTEFTRVVIKSDPKSRISVVARGNSSVVARGNSSVVARGNSSVEAWDNSSVEAWGNSSIEAWDNSSVVAWDNSSVVARGNSSIEAWDNSSVVARDNSSVVARGNSSVVARDNSSVEARGNSSVEARGNSVVRVFSSTVRTVLFGFAVAFLSSAVSLTGVEEKSEHCHVQVVHHLGWFEANGIEKTEFIVLFKRVSADWKTQENTKNETVWPVGSVVTHPKWAPQKEECGEGKFHACSRPYFCDEFRNTPGDRYVAIRVALADVYEWPEPQYPHKEPRRF